MSLMRARNLQGMMGIIIYCLLVHQAWASTEWIYFTSSAARDAYYDKSTVVKLDKDVVRAWTKQVLSENGKIKTLAHLRAKGKTDTNLDLISYVLRLSEIDCVNKRIKDTSMIVYDEKNNILYSSQKGETGKWEDILPNSSADTLKNILCEASSIAKESATTASELSSKKMTLVKSQKGASPAIQEEISHMLNQWVASWQSGDMESYRGFYDRDFESKNMKLDEWIQYKSDVWNKSRNLTIRIDHLKISARDDQARVVFIQTYSSSILKDKGKKTLHLKKIGDEWKIYRETM